VDEMVERIRYCLDLTLDDLRGRGLMD